MITDRPIHHYARLTLEARTAHGIHSGQGDATHDVLLVRDANGLPALPATSLAGVLRHLYRRRFGAEAADRLLGHAEGDSGRPSWVGFSWMLVHDSRDRAEEGLREDLEQDSLLSHLVQAKPQVRQRVRLNARGAAAFEGKFDTTLIPAGVRYSGFIHYWSDGSEAAETAWFDLLALLTEPGFRLGHGTRSGAGAFEVRDLRMARWDLTTPEGREGYRQRPRRRIQTEGLIPHTLSAATDDPVLTVRLELKAEAGWRVGGGEYSLSSPDGGRVPDLLPQSETAVHWRQGEGELQRRRPVLPATAVKGALAHRVAFHYRRLVGHWSRPGSRPADPRDCPAVQALFGWAGDDGTGRAGQVLIDDLYLDEPQVVRQMHNRIDRYTGGVISGALFEEELLWRTSLTLTLILPDSRGREALDPAIRQALDLTLKDLGRGWLPLGAAGSRGQGIFQGTKPPHWSDGGRWCRARCRPAPCESEEVTS